MAPETVKKVTTDCRFLPPREAIAQALCHEAMPSLRASMKRVCRIDYRGAGNLPLEEQRHDPIAVYQRFLELSLTRNVSASVQRLFARRFGAPIPWIVDAQHRPLIESALKRAKRQSLREGALNPRTPKVLRDARALLAAVRAPTSEAGLGLRYEDHNEGDVNINAALDRGFIGCDEFRAIYIALARRMGLAAHPIEIQSKNFDGDEAPHSVVMVSDRAAGKRYFVDMQDDAVTETPPNKEYYVGTAADIFAVHLYNKSFVRPRGQWEMTKAPDAPILGGLAVAPDNAVLLMGLGVYHYGRAEEDRALPHFRRVLELMPQHGSARQYICIIDASDASCATPASPPMQPPSK